MLKSILRTGLFSALLLMSLALLPGRSAGAPPNAIIPNVIGFWSGEWASVSGATGVATLDVSDQDHRRFEGTFVFTPPQPIAPPNPCFALGTVSQSGEISMVGDNGVFFLHAHGQTHAGVMQLEYMMFFADGSFDMGTASIDLQSGNGT